MKTYTVLLLRPDYIADNFGTDTYLTHIEAENVSAAELASKYEVAEVDYIDDEFTFEEAIEQGQLDIQDYVVLMVIEGKHLDTKES